MVDNQLIKNESSLLIFNDNFGAISLNFTDNNVQTITDSYISQLALTHNGEQNNLTLTNIKQCSSLDELPGLISVLKGDMSLVGPRPVVPDELPRYGALTQKYLSARPGMTGLWQVSGRNDVTYRERVSLDCYYIENWKLHTDFVLMLKTVTVIFHGKGAY